MYGHAVEAGGHLWLQYWFFYFYNDYNLALGIGLHEGDWEMIQLRIHDGAPDLAVYAQHRQAEKRPWAQVGKVPGDPNRPMVYVARGSHASYFEPGFHQTEAWYDLADGKRNSPRTTLEIVTDDDPPWIAWPGRVGRHPRARRRHRPAQPAGAVRRTPQWSNPDAALATAWEPQRKDAIDAPAVIISRDRGRMRIDFDFTAPGRPARGLAAGHGQLERRGRRAAAHLHLPRRGDPPRHAVDRGPARPRQALRRLRSTTTGDPPIPSESTLTELDPAGKVAKLPLAERLIGGFGRLVARLRGQLGR